MDSTLAIVIVAALIVGLLLFGLSRFRRLGKFRLKFPWGFDAEFEGSNERATPQPAINIERAESRHGGLDAADETGHGVDLRDIAVRRDIRASSRQSGREPDPKS